MVTMNISFGDTLPSLPLQRLVSGALADLTTCLRAGNVADTSESLCSSALIVREEDDSAGDLRKFNDTTDKVQQDHGSKTLRVLPIVHCGI